jgi:hypothetical protein
MTEEEEDLTVEAVWNSTGAGSTGTEMTEEEEDLTVGTDADLTAETGTS